MQFFKKTYSSFANLKSMDVDSRRDYD